MQKSIFDSPATRREFLQHGGRGLGLLAFSSVAPSFITQSLRAGTPLPEKDRSILVLIQLAGGNDGLNTVVPYADDQYHRLRPLLGLGADKVLKLDDHHGLHPSCTGLHRLFKDGKLGIIQNVGYPNPNRSHFRSMEIWETASGSNEYLTDGWIGRYFDNCCSGTPGKEPVGISIGDELPDAFLSGMDHHIFSMAAGNARESRALPGMKEALGNDKASPDSNLHFLQHTLMDTLVTEEKVTSRLEAYKPMAGYPSNPLGQSLRKVAALIASGMETRVYFVSHGGFDTHVNQVDRHQRLLKQLSDSMEAFQADLKAHLLEDQVLTMTFSEFGRRPSENASGGTDHGTAAPLFVMGTRLEGSLHGTAPDLDIPKNRDLEYTTDFRSVYSTVMEDWLDADPNRVLGKRYTGMNFLGKA